MNQGTLYPVLLKLEQEGSIDSEWGISENNRKARFYKLTPLGAAELRRQVRQFDDVVQAITLVIRTA